jgi:carboxyl-terminal processing protease
MGPQRRAKRGREVTLCHYPVQPTGAYCNGTILASAVLQLMTNLNAAVTGAIAARNLRRNTREEVVMTRTNERIFGLFLLFTIAASVSWQGLGAKTSSTSEEISPDVRQLDLLGHVFGLVLSESVEVPDQRKLIRAAINGMLASVDPHSTFMDRKELKAFKAEATGKFGGLGLEVTMENGVLKVIAPLDDTPAAHAGILANDLVTHLDGEEVLGMTINEAIDKMRGKINTQITLTILRPGKEDSFDVKLTRDVIRIKSVKANAEGDIGYLRISSFTEQTQRGFEAAILA